MSVRYTWPVNKGFWLIIVFRKLLNLNLFFRFHYLKRKVLPSLGLRRRAYTINDVDDVLNKANVS